MKSLCKSSCGLIALEEGLGLEVQRLALQRFVIHRVEALHMQRFARSHHSFGPWFDVLVCPFTVCTLALGHDLAPLVLDQHVSSEPSHCLRLRAAEHKNFGKSASSDLAHRLLLHCLHGLHSLHRFHCLRHTDQVMETESRG